MVKGAYSEAFGRFYFNLSGDVGPHGKNNLDDVEYVRFGLLCMSKSPLNAGQQSKDFDEFKSIVNRLRLTGGYEPDVGAAVLAFQKATKRPQDSTVSMIPNSYVGDGNAGAYMLHYIHSSIVSLHGQRYPRIDQIADTGPALTPSVKAIFEGK